MTGSDFDATGRLDDLDAEILAGVRDLFDTVDPPADDLVARVQFALQLADVDIEVARLCAQHTVAVRGDEASLTVTFDTDSMTIMINVSDTAPDRVRVDGWLAPPARLTVELRTRHAPMRTEADDEGRFVFDAVPHGLVQFAVHADGSQRLVVTPSIVV